MSADTRDFEEWAKTNGLNIAHYDESGNHYLSLKTEMSWRAWKAASKLNRGNSSKQENVFSKEQSQAQAWLAVAKLLHELTPDWSNHEDKTGVDCALDMIRELHAKANQNWRVACDLLDSIKPGWWRHGESIEKCALEAIGELDDKARAGAADSRLKFGHQSAWLNVCNLLDELKPGWWREEGTVEQCALRTIKKLHAKANAKQAHSGTHSTLTMTRMESPETCWRWTVKLPDGRVWASSARQSFDETLVSLAGVGAKKLAEAEGIDRIGFIAQEVCQAPEFHRTVFGR